MHSNRVESRVFWPKHISDQRQCGYVVGWNIRSFIACVACFVTDVKLEDLLAITNAWMQNTDDHRMLKRIQNTCDSVPTVLGAVYVAPDERSEPDLGILDVDKECALFP